MRRTKMGDCVVVIIDYSFCSNFCQTAIRYNWSFLYKDFLDCYVLFGGATLKMKAENFGVGMKSST